MRTAGEICAISKNRRAARTTRLESSQGSVASLHVKAMPDSEVDSSVSVSASVIATKWDSMAWNPSGRFPKTESDKLILAGAVRSIGRGG